MMFNFFLSLANASLAGKHAMSVEGSNKPEEPKKEPEQPPDLDELFNRLLGRKSSPEQRPERNQSPVPKASGSLILALTATALALWLASGFYTVQEREHGVEIFLGKYQGTTKSGLNWNWPAPLGSVEKVNVSSISTMRVGELKTQKGSASTKEQRTGQMLTSDENIVEIGATVQYRIRDAKSYLFRAQQPDKVLEDIVVSAIREVVGANSVDDVLRDKRNEWPEQAKSIMVKILQQYDLGIEIIAFELQDARAPAEVQDAFEDAVRAREDEERARLQAEAFANQRLPSARGEAEQMRQNAQAYKAQVLAQAKADSNRFTALLKAYQLNREVMRERLYLDTMSAVMANSSKVLVDADGTKPIINLAANGPLPMAPPVAAEPVEEKAPARVTATPTASPSPTAPTAVDLRSRRR